MEKTEGRGASQGARARATSGHSPLRVRTCSSSLLFRGYYNLAAGRGDATHAQRASARRAARARARKRVLYTSSTRLQRTGVCSFGRIVRTFCSPANSTPDPHEQCEKLSPRCEMAPFCVSDVLIHRVNPPKHLSTAYVEELTEGVARAKKLLRVLRVPLEQPDLSLVPLPRRAIKPIIDLKRKVCEREDSASFTSLCGEEGFAPHERRRRHPGIHSWHVCGHRRSHGSDCGARLVRRRRCKIRPAASSNCSQTCKGAERNGSRGSSAE